MTIPDGSYPTHNDFCPCSVRDSKWQTDYFHGSSYPANEKYPLLYIRKNPVLQPETAECLQKIYISSKCRHLTILHCSFRQCTAELIYWSLENSATAVMFLLFRQEVSWCRVSQLQSPVCQWERLYCLHRKQAEENEKKQERLLVQQWFCLLQYPFC